MLGFGNVLLCDDATGVRVVEMLKREPWALSHSVVCLDCGTLSYTILPYLGATDTLLVIDAAEIGAPPGTVKTYADEAMDRFWLSTRRRTVHEVGLIDLLDMARLHGCLPARRALVCVQPGVIDWSESLSPAVREALPRALRAALLQLALWHGP